MSRVVNAGSGFGRSVLCRVGCLGPEGLRHMYEMDLEHFASPSVSVAVAKCCFGGFVERSYVISFAETPTLMTGFLTVY